MSARQFSNLGVRLRWLATRQARRRAMKWLLPFATVPVLAGISSCAATRVATLGDPQLGEATQAHRVAVSGYTTSDGNYHSFDGFVIQTSDSLIFVRPATRTRFAAAGAPETVIRLSRPEVQSVALEHLSVARTLLFSTAMFGLLVLALMSGGLTP